MRARWMLLALCLPVLASAAPATPPAELVGLCDALARVTVAADEARARGVPQAVAMAELEGVANPVARQAAGAAIWYAYTSNADGRLSAAKLASVVRRACLITGRVPQ